MGITKTVTSTQKKTGDNPPLSFIVIDLLLLALASVKIAV
ncbi:hypothetical protein THF1C08_120103 [Vibrio jasicida]|nr:hypothetical protein THF1C08_120103 [Vibrio jasicida]